MTLPIGSERKIQLSIGAATLFEDLAPKLRELTENLLFKDVWNRPELSARDRSLSTITALITLGQTEQLLVHAQRGLDNGLTRQELVELITHLAFYAGWPRALSAFQTLKPLLKGE